MANKAEKNLINILDRWDSATDSILDEMAESGLVVVKKSELPVVTIVDKREKPITCQVTIDGVLKFDGVDRSALLQIHRCHTENVPNGVHAINCPTGEHPLGWQHIPGVHKMCQECG